MQTRLWQSSATACALAAAVDVFAQAERWHGLARDIGEDRFVAGGSVSVTKSIAGDLLAAGGNLDADADVGGDAVVGGNVRLGAPIRQGLYAAGGRVSVNTTVQKNARIAAGNIIIGPQAKIAGNLTVGGGEISIAPKPQNPMI